MFCNENRIVAPSELPDLLEKAEKKFREFMEVLEIDCENDPNSIDTPKRVAKMYINELFKGRYTAKPKITTFPNTKQYDEIIFTNCEVVSTCSHHWLSFFCKIYIGVLTNPDPDSQLMGLSKYSRLAEWIFSRPTIQEESTAQLHEEIDTICKGNKGIMVYVIGQHSCCTSRGAKQPNGKMITSKCSGAFKESSSTRSEFLSMVNNV